VSQLEVKVLQASKVCVFVGAAGPPLWYIQKTLQISATWKK